MNTINRLLCGCFCALFTGTALTELAQTEIPPGFDFLNDIQTSSIDVYYNNRPIGSFVTEYNYEKLKFVYPELIISRITDIKTPQAVITALTDWISPHTNRHCKTGQYENCGFITPDIAGVIFYENQFRADLFINPLYLQKATQTIQYLPPSSAELAFLQDLTAYFSGDDNHYTEDSYNLSGKSLLGWQQNHIESSWNHADDRSFSIATLSANHDAEGHHYSAGFLQSRFGFSQFLYSRPMLGVSLGTSEDTLLNREELASDPLYINLPAQALVEVYKDNLLIHSQLLESGPQRLNTSQFPYGTYNVVIKAKTPDGITLFGEQRLFVKQTRIHTGNYRGWFFESGQMTKLSDSGLPDSEHAWLTRAGYEAGLRNDLGARFTLAASGKELISESELGFTRPGIWLSAGLLLGKEQRGSSLSSEIVFQDMIIQGNSRRVWKNRDECKTEKNDRCLLSSLKAYDNLSLYSRFFTGRLFVRYNFREQEGRSEHSKSVGFYQQLYQQGRQTLGWDAEVDKEDSALTFRISIDLTFDVMNWKNQINSQYQKRKLDHHSSEYNYRVAARSYWIDQNPDRTQSLQGSVGFDKTRHTDTLTGTVINRNGWLHTHLTCAFSQSSQTDNHPRTTSYMGSFSTALTVDRSGVALGGTDLYDSAINVSMQGAKPEDTFQILIDDHVRGFVSGKGTTVVPLPAFRSYRVNIENAGDGFFEGHNRRHTVTLYPGNVAHVDFTVWRTLVIYGRLLDSKGQLLKDYCYNNRQFLSCTDEYGLFQLEVKDSLQSVKFGHKHQWCNITFNPEEAEEGILNLGDIPCL